MITGTASTTWWCRLSAAAPMTSSRSPSTGITWSASLSRAIQMRELSRRSRNSQAALERHLNDLEAIVEERTRELRETNEVIESRCGC